MKTLPRVCLALSLALLACGLIALAPAQATPAPAAPCLVATPSVITDTVALPMEAAAAVLPAGQSLDDASKRELPVADGMRRTLNVPILMYHYISDAPKGADRVRRDLSLSGADFELQLRYLANEGYHSVSLADLTRYVLSGTTLPDRPIVLTFDDGYKDAYTVAFPLLKKYGFTGTFFVFTKPIDEENRDYLSWREIELMSAAGMEFGSHSRSHPDLKGKPADFLEREIVESRSDIEAHIGRPVHFFCYPSGSYDRKVVRAAKDAGYWGAVTIRQGTQHSADDLLELTRIRIRGGDGLERFDALLNRDW